MARPRVAIRAFTCRRDVANALLLARLLEHRGCEALVTCVRDFERTLRLWKPEVAVVNARGYPRAVKRIAPETSVVLFDGEGLSPPEDSIGRYLFKYPDIYHVSDLILLWGKRNFQEIQDECKVHGFDMEKVHIVGNPRLDLVRFLPDHVRYNARSNTIGVVMRFRSINDHANRSTLRFLPNPGNLEDTIVQCKHFVGLIDAVRVLLEKTDYSFEIRPHPLEQIDSYREFKAFWFKPEHHDRVTIDDTLSFAEFAVKHRALISPTTTSFLKAYLKKVPVINIDHLCGTLDHNREADLGLEWRGAGLQPRTMVELVDLLSQPDLPAVAQDDVIERQLIDYCEFDQPRSACLRAAIAIADLAQRTRAPSRMRMPTWALDRIDAISFRRAMRKNPWHHNMNFRRGFHKPPAYLEELAVNCLKVG